MVLSKEQAKAIFTAKGLSGAELDAAIKTAALSATQTKATATTGGLSTAYKGLAASIGVSTTALTVMLGALVAVSVGAIAIKKYNQYVKEQNDSARETAQAIADQNKSLDDNISKLKELRSKLDDSNTSESEAYDIKKQLYEIQKSLIESYGDEAEGLRLVNGEIDTQIDKLKTLSKEKAIAWQRDNQDAINRANEVMTKEQLLFVGGEFNLDKVSSQEQIDAIEKAANKYVADGLSIDLASNINERGKIDYEIIFTGDPTNAKKVLEEFSADIQSLSNEFGEGNNRILENLVATSAEQLKQQSKIIEENLSTYVTNLQAYIAQAQNIDFDGKSYSPNKVYGDYLSAIDDYNKALSTGDGIKEAKKEYESLLPIINEIIKKNEDFAYLFNDENSGLNTTLVDRQSYVDNFDVSSFYKQRADLLKGLQDVDLETSNMTDEQKQSFDWLTEAAGLYNLSLEDTVDILKELGIVSGNTADAATELPKAFSKSEMIAAINATTDGFESLDKIMSSMKGKNPFDYALLDDKNFKDTFSGLEESYENFVEKISNSPKDVNGCQSAFDDLLTTWLNSTDIISGLSDETAQLTIDMLSNMGVANAETIITDILAQRHAELSAEKYYNANASEALKNNTLDEYVAFLNEADGADISKQALAQLELAKIAVNNAQIDTSSDIDQVINLANAAGAGAQALGKLARAKAVFAQAESGSLDLNVPGNNLLLAEAENTVKEIGNGGFDYEFKIDANQFKSATYGGGAKTNKSGSGGSKGSKSKEPTEFDWMEQKITILNAQVDKLKSNIESLVGYKNKNSMTHTAIDVLTEKMGVLQQMHDKYMEKADSLGLSQEYINKIQSGTIEIESIGDENLANVIKEYQDLFGKAQDVNNQIIETKKSIHDLNLSKLDNIINQFEQMTDIQSQMIDTEKQLIDLREKSGEEIYADDYISLAGKQLKLTRQNVDAYNELASEMSRLNLQEGTEEWKKYNDQLQEYKNNMISAADAIEQYKDAMTDLVYKGLNDFISAMDSINGTISTMNSLIGDTNLIDAFGNLTDRGLAQIALYAHQMTNAKQEAAEYAEAIKSLEDALDSGLITQDEYNSMLQEYTASQESAVKSSKEARDAIISLVKEGIQAEIDAKKKLIDETKAALDAEKDLHDYQKSITEKQDNISKLERQIAALSNSTNRNDIAQRLQLQSQLAQAKEELYELQYDHEIEQRKEALDEEYNSFEESKQKESDELDSNLDAQNAAIEKYLNEVKTKYSTVYGVLTQYGDEYSLSAIEDLTKPWESGSEAADLCANAIGDAVANIQYEIDGLDFSSLYELVDLLNQVGMGGYGEGSSSAYEDVTDQGSWQKGQGGKWWYGNSNDDYVSGDIYTINGKQYGFDDDGYMVTGWRDDFGDWRYFEPANGEMVKSQWRKSKNNEWYYLDKDGIMATDMAVKAREDDGYYYLDDEGKWDGETLTAEQVRKLGYTIGYKKGTKRITHDQLAWTQEDEPEIITRPSDGALLTPLKLGDGVINGDLTQNLLDIARNPNSFVQDILARSMPNYKVPEFEIVRNQPVEINSPLVQIDGTGLSANEVAAIIKNETRDIDKRVAKSIKHELLGK